MYTLPWSLSSSVWEGTKGFLSIDVLSTNTSGDDAEFVVETEVLLYSFNFLLDDISNADVGVYGKFTGDL